jgi:hypothetical protein
MSSAVLSLPLTFRCISCRVKSFLSQVVLFSHFPQTS